MLGLLKGFLVEKPCYSLGACKKITSNSAHGAQRNSGMLQAISATTRMMLGRIIWTNVVANEMQWCHDKIVDSDQ